ncbi:unnamed protein product [Dovyalis caffra]|uniref:Uncharacterized protein n=1 Tax=Dovyalis caffra TaxID=77055 RepID=A0AAV1SSP6_9ROSI|nr:unnamed protein product [Dovyalis caffra]
MQRQPASSKSGSLVITVEGSQSERNVPGSNVTSWTKLVLDMYPPGTSISALLPLRDDRIVIDLTKRSLHGLEIRILDDAKVLNLKILKRDAYKHVGNFDMFLFLHERSIAMIVTNVYFSLTIIVFGLGHALAGEIIVDFVAMGQHIWIEDLCFALGWAIWFTGHDAYQLKHVEGCDYDPAIVYFVNCLDLSPAAPHFP